MKKKNVEFWLFVMSSIGIIFFLGNLIFIDHNPLHELKALLFKDKFLKHDKLIVFGTEISSRNTYVVHEVDDLVIYGVLENEDDKSSTYSLFLGVSEDPWKEIKDTIISKGDTLQYVEILKSNDSKVIYPAHNDAYLKREIFTNTFLLLLYSLPFFFFPYMYIQYYIRNKPKLEKNKAV